MTYVYPLFVTSEGARAYSSYKVSLHSIYLTEEDAIRALDAIPEDPECEYQVEEWPANEKGGKFNIRVVRSK